MKRETTGRLVVFAILAIPLSMVVGIVLVAYIVLHFIIKFW